MSKYVLYQGKSSQCGYWPDNKSLSTKFIYASHPTNAREAKFELLEKGGLSGVSVTFVPICPSCPAYKFCRSTRLNLEEHRVSPSQNTKLNRFFEHAEFSIEPVHFEPEHFSLFRSYVRARHGNTATELANIDKEHFKELYTNHITWQVVSRNKTTKKPVSVAYVDSHGSDYCLEYVYYDMDHAKLSPGICSTLFLARALQASHGRSLYLGAWSPLSPKLGYKSLFRGMEIHTDKGWVAYDKDLHPEAPPPTGYQATFKP